MRLIPLALTGLALAGCGEGAPTAPAGDQGDQPQPSVTSCSSVATWQGFSNPLNVTANSSGNDAQWFIKNNGATNVTLNSESFGGDGTVVTSTSSTNWVVFPHVMPPGQQIDADVLFDAAGPGTGSVGLQVLTSCGKVVFPTYTVNAN